MITYDVSTVDAAGKKRLRRVARACEDWGQRVQQSVFECRVDPAQFAELRKRLVDIVDPTTDSLRFYHLGSKKRLRVEHIGIKPSKDMDGPLLA